MLPARIRFMICRSPVETDAPAGQCVLMCNEVLEKPREIFSKLGKTRERFENLRNADNVIICFAS
jgi:hypothetical protein